MTVTLMARVTETHTLEIDLPESVPAGEARVTIEVPAEYEALAGEEIVARGLTGGWAGEEIADGQAWVEEARQQRRSRRS